MFEFVAIGRERNQYWRRELAPDQMIRLGRMQDSGWEVPWDRRISRDHADLVLQGDRLLVRCLPSARNSAYIVDAPLREFSIVAGEQFRIGDTVFRLELASARTPLDQIDEFFRSELTEFRTKPSPQQEVSVLRDELMALRQKLAEANETPALREDSKSQIGELLTDIQEVNDLWKAESRTLRDANQRMEAKNKKLNQEIAQLESLIEKREDERRLSDVTLLQQLQDLTALEQRCKKLTDALGAAQKDHEQREKNAQLQKAEAQNLRSQSDDLKSKLGEEKQALQQSEAQTRQLSEELSSLRSELAQLREQIGSAAANEDAREHALRRAKEASQKATEIRS